MEIASLQKVEGRLRAINDPPPILTKRGALCTADCPLDRLVQHLNTSVFGGGHISLEN